MAPDGGIIEVRGSEVRCSGTRDTPHEDVLVSIPTDETVACPECGLRYRRARWWNVISGAIWPSAH